MRKTTDFIFILIFIFAIACNSRDRSNNAPMEPATEVENSGPEEFTFEADDKFRLKEQLFFYLREKVVDMDMNTFVKSESIEIEGNSFEYRAVIMDKDLIAPTVSMDPTKPRITFAYNRWPSDQSGDEITITGSLAILDVLRIGTEGLPKTVRIKLTASYKNSYLASSPYAYDGYERRESYDKLQQELIVKLDEPRIYGRENLYLKARIKVLAEGDLAGLSGEELPYFRNEIFARYGHVFKTDKMKKYFEQQSWYSPYFFDATGQLNDIEKANVLFIKSLES